MTTLQITGLPWRFLLAVNSDTGREKIFFAMCASALNKERGLRNLALSRKATNGYSPSACTSESVVDTTLH